MTEAQPVKHRYQERQRVHWPDTGMHNTVANAHHYLTYVDTAITGYWRALGLPYQAAMALLAGDLYLKKAAVEYHGCVAYGDVLSISLCCKYMATASMVFEAAIVRGNTILASVELVYVFADPSINFDAKVNKPIPDMLRQLIEHYEAGAEVIQLRTGTWSELGTLASEVRIAVFVQEQGFSREDEWDDMDAQCLHAVLINGLNQPLATGRLLPSVGGQATVGRMAVSRALRGAGQGARILQALCLKAKERGDREVLLHAQLSAQGFYARLGFQVVGQPFVQAGVAHVSMSKLLS